MSATITPLSVTINALRINNSKITSALFQQFESGSLLRDIGWPGFLYGEEAFFSTPFNILGRHTYKIAEQDQHTVPFLYCVNNEIKVSSLSALESQSFSLLDNLRTEALGETKKLCEIATIIAANPKKGLELLASEGLLGSTFDEFDHAFYQWQPLLHESEPHTVTLSPIHKNMLLKYGEASSQLISSVWGDELSEKASREQRAKTIEDIEASIADAKLDILVQRWFSLNAGILSEERDLAETLYRSYESNFDQIKTQIKSSPKVYVGV